jgi:hypothetical protein
VCLESMYTMSKAGWLEQMLDWLRLDLARVAADGGTKWLVAFWHHPPYSKGSHDSDTEEEMVTMRDAVVRTHTPPRPVHLRRDCSLGATGWGSQVPLLEAAGVDLVLCGHSHAYERSALAYGMAGDSSAFLAESMWCAHAPLRLWPSPHEGEVLRLAGVSTHLLRARFHSTVHAGWTARTATQRKATCTPKPRTALRRARARSSSSPAAPPGCGRRPTSWLFCLRSDDLPGVKAMRFIRCAAQPANEQGRVSIPVTG